MDPLPLSVGLLRPGILGFLVAATLNVQLRSTEHYWTDFFQPLPFAPHWSMKVLMRYFESLKGHSGSNSSRRNFFLSI